MGISLPAIALSRPIQGALAAVGGVVGKTQVPTNFSRDEDIPQWYKEYVPKRTGAEGVPKY